MIKLVWISSWNCSVEINWVFTAMHIEVTLNLYFSWKWSAVITIAHTIFATQCQNMITTAKQESCYEKKSLCSLMRCLHFVIPFIVGTLFLTGNYINKTVFLHINTIWWKHIRKAYSAFSMHCSRPLGSFHRWQWSPRLDLGAQPMWLLCALGHSFNLITGTRHWNYRT